MEKFEDVSQKLVNTLDKIINFMSKVDQLYKNICIIVLCFVIVFIYNLSNLVEPDNSWLRLIFSLLTILISLRCEIHILKQWKELIKNGTLFIITSIISISGLFGIIYNTILVIFPGSFIDINFESYDKNILGAIMITLDMYHYSIGNSLFGSSTFTPGNTWVRTINTIHILLSYTIIIRGVIDVSKNKLTDLLIRNSELSTEALTNTNNSLKLVNNSIEQMDKYMKTNNKNMEINHKLIAILEEHDIINVKRGEI